MLSVLAALAICVGYMCVLLCLTGALWLYVKWGAWHTPDARGEWPL